MPSCERMHPEEEGKPSWRHRRSPPWWPENEPWPPRPGDNRQMGWRMRGQFFRRIGCIFTALALFGALIFSALFWLIVSAFEDISISPGAVAVLRTAGIALLVVGLVSIILAGLALRRSALPFGKMLDAVGRISGGDYSVSVPEWGPPEMRSLAQAFNSMARRLEETDRQRRNLLADVSHELRTPLTIIQGNLEGMLDGIYPPDPEHIQSILDETHLLSRIIDDLRTLSLAESGALQLQTETVDLGDLVEDVLESFAAQAQRGQTTLRAEIQPGLPALEIDPTRIREVLANLLSNALRHTAPGGEIILRAGTEDHAPGRVRLSVSDTGEGISPEDLPYIFDRFYKSNQSGGSGLGLAIAKSLVAAHGGGISAESALGRGTTITLTFLSRPPVTPGNRLE